MADLSSPDRHITAKDMKCLKEAFALFDRDRDGEINTEELGKVMYFLKLLYSDLACEIKMKLTLDRAFYICCYVLIIVPQVHPNIEY